MYQYIRVNGDKTQYYFKHVVLASCCSKRHYGCHAVLCFDTTTFLSEWCIALTCEDRSQRRYQELSLFSNTTHHFQSNRFDDDALTFPLQYQTVGGYGLQIVRTARPRCVLPSPRNFPPVEIGQGYPPRSEHPKSHREVQYPS